MTNKLGVKEVERKLRRITAERGHEYTYETPWYEDETGEMVEALECYYSDAAGNPSCIVGVLLKDVAPGTYKRLHQFEWDGGYEPNSASVDQICGENNVVDGVNLEEIFEPEALSLLLRVQRVQDRGETWGVAVDQAVKLI